MTVYYQDAQTSRFRTAHLRRGKSPTDESKRGRISISPPFLQVSCSLPPSPTQLDFPITVIKKGGHSPMECFFCLKLPYQKFIVLFLKKDVTFIATTLLCTNAIFCKSDTKCFYISYCWEKRFVNIY